MNKLTLKAFLLFLTITNISLLIACNSSHQNYVEQDLSRGEIDSSDIYNGIAKDGWVFYSGDIEHTNLYKIRINGKDKKLLKRARAEVIDVIDDWIFYNDLNKSAIYKIRVNGKDNKMVFGGKRQKGYCARGFRITNGWIYFTDWYSMYEIYRVKTDGSNIEQISHSTYGKKIESNGWIYYIDYQTRNISRVKIDASNSEILSDSNTRDFCIDGETIYYCDSTYEGIGKAYKMSINGEGKKIIIDDKVEAICYSDGWLIFNSGHIYKVKIGSDVIIQILQGAYRMEVHGKWLYYWVEPGNNQLLADRLDLNDNTN